MNDGGTVTPTEGPDDDDIEGIPDLQDGGADSGADDGADDGANNPPSNEAAAG